MLSRQDKSGYMNFQPLLTKSKEALKKLLLQVSFHFNLLQKNKK